jgi:hypothetical protein
MTSSTISTISANRPRGPASMVTRPWRRFLVPHRRRSDVPPPPAGPRFRKVWKEVAPGQWQWIHIGGEVDHR